MTARLQQQCLDPAVAQAAVQIGGGGRRKPVVARLHVADDRHHLVEQHIVEAAVQRHEVGNPVREVVKERPFRHACTRDDSVHREPLEPEFLGQHQPGFDQLRARLLRGGHSLVRHMHDC